MASLRTVCCLIVVFASVVFSDDLSTTKADNERILHGRKVTSMSEYPFMVSMQLTFPLLKTTAKFCGGAILNKRVIVSAAHCFEGMDDPKMLRVHAGSVEVFDYSDSQFKRVNRVIPHPEYNLDGEFKNDIALVVLAEPLHFDQMVQPITFADEEYDPPIRSEGTILGWGSTNNEETVSPSHLMKATIPVSRRSRCERYITGTLTQNQICLGLDSIVNACAGDSGGPFIQVVDRKPILVGVTSFGNVGCYEMRPIIYTRVGAYKKFIDEILEKYSF